MNNGLDNFLAPYTRPISHEEFETLATRNPDQLFLVILPFYEGAADAMNEIEQTLYKLNTPANDLYNIAIINWPNDPELAMPVCMAYMPMKDRPQIEKILASQKPRPFRIIDGVPQMSRPNGHLLPCNREMMGQDCAGPACDCERWYHWPVKGSNVYQIGYEGGVGAFIREFKK